MSLLPSLCFCFSIIVFKGSCGFLRESNSDATRFTDEVISCVDTIAKKFFTRKEDVLIVSSRDSIIAEELLRRFEPHFGINLANNESTINFGHIYDYIILGDDSRRDPYEMVEKMSINPRGRYVIVTEGELEALETAASRFWSSGIPNVIFLESLNAEKIRIFGYEVSWHHLNSTRLVFLAEWKGAFLNRSDLFPSKFKNMEKYPLKVTVLNNRQMEPEIYVRRNNGDLAIEGVGSSLLNVFAKKLNFTVIVYENSYYGHKQTNGTWIGPPGQLIRGDADLTFAGLLPTMRVTEALDYSDCYRWDALSFVIKSAKKTVSWKSVFKPLSLAVWICQLLVLLATLCLARIAREFWSMNMLKEYIRSIDVLRVLFIQSVVYPKYTGIRLAFALWLIYSYLITTSFTGSLVNFLSTPSFNSIPNNFKELSDSNLEIGGMLSVKRSLDSTGGHVERKIRDRFVNLTYFDFWMILDAKDRAVVVYRTAAIRHNWRNRLNDSMRVHIVDETIMHVPFFYYMRKGHPYREPLNQFIRMIHSSGLITKWMSDYNAIKVEKNREQESVVLTLEHLAGVFLILICGHVVSTIRFFYELYHRG